MDRRPSPSSRNPIQLIEEHFRGTRISTDYGLRVNVSRARYVEQAHFTIWLVEERSDKVSAGPAFVGLLSAGRPSQTIPGWVDGDFFDMAVFSDGTRLSLGDASLDIALFKPLGGLIPPGGSLMVSYSLFANESKLHRETRRGLDRGYPPVVTPLGFLLYSAGCGIGFKDWYFAEGGREGPEKLQGYKPLNSEVAKEKTDSMLRELHDFANRIPQDDFAQVCKSRAERVISELGHVRGEF